MDPILAAATPHVEALSTLTAPQGTTLISTYAYFKSVQPNCNTVRLDGKKITFVNGFHKTNIKQDIDFLRVCIAADPTGPFSEVTGSDIATAEALIDPVAAQKKAVLASVLAELAAAGVDLTAVGGPAAAAATAATALNQTVQEETELVAAAQTGIDSVTSGNAGAALLAGVDAASAAIARLSALRAQKDANGATIQPVNAVTGAAIPLLTPVSSSDLAGAASGSNSTGDASAA